MKHIWDPARAGSEEDAQYEAFIAAAGELYLFSLANKHITRCAALAHVGSDVFGRKRNCKRGRRVIGVRVCGRTAGKAGLGFSARSGAAHGTAYTKLTRSTTMQKIAARTASTYLKSSRSSGTAVDTLHDFDDAQYARAEAGPWLAARTCFWLAL